MNLPPPPPKKDIKNHITLIVEKKKITLGNVLLNYRVFSDGGNFCPEEIKEYCKKLDQSSQKIDKCEGAVMLELEGLESKRREQVTRVVVEFDDR